MGLINSRTKGIKRDLFDRKLNATNSLIKKFLTWQESSTAAPVAMEDFEDVFSIMSLQHAVCLLDLEYFGKGGEYNVTCAVAVFINLLKLATLYDENKLSFTYF